jgi:hypothetical protein
MRKSPEILTISLYAKYRYLPIQNSPIQRNGSLKAENRYIPNRYRPPLLVRNLIPWHVLNRTKTFQKIPLTVLKISHARDSPVPGLHYVPA